MVRRNPVTRVRARVLTADDHAPFLAVLRELLSATKQLETVGEAPSGEAAVEMAAALQPDMVLIDVRMPGLGGVDAAEQIKARRPRTLVVLISATHPGELPAHVLDSGADAVLWKSDLEPRLLDDLWLRHRAAGAKR